MKIILVPTDFSENANHAIQYAIALAGMEPSRIVLLHVYQVLYPVNNGPAMFSPELNDEIRQASEKQLKEWSTKIHASKIKCSVVNKEGDITDVILRTIAKKRINLVVMGTKGASGLKRVLFGSNTAKIAQKATCPVLAVPENATLRKLRKIAFATNYHSSDFVIMKRLIGLTGHLNPAIQLVHIVSSKNNQQIQKLLLKNFARQMNDRTKHGAFSFRLLFAKNPEMGLDDYARKERPDILVISSHFRTITDNLFGAGLTKQMAYHTNVPLMIFHFREKSTMMI